MKEIRIYFECLEQAEHFIKPILKNTSAYNNKLFEITLIKLNSRSENYSRFIAPVIFLKNPDILITIIEDDIEYPLFQLEISTAVFTEDHELQRFDGIVASIENNCIYGKLSPLNKISQSSHGGNTKFNYLSSYKAIYDNFGVLAFHFDWPCDQYGNVIVNQEFLSCPPEIKSIIVFINVLINYVTVKKFVFSNWIKEFEVKLLEEKDFSEWIEVMKNFEIPNFQNLNTSRTIWKEDNNELHIKINRFGHAMDPERGMLAYYGTICKNSVAYMIFNKDNIAWFKDTPKETFITEYISEHGLANATHYLNCFLYGSGLHSNKYFIEYIDKYLTEINDLIEIDLNEFLTSHYFTLNKALRTVFKFTSQLHIKDNNNQIKVKLHWNRFNNKINYEYLPLITPIRKRRVIDEDDVTYISIHNVFKQSGYKIIAVSYPGAQGDRVILTEAGTGRTQKRSYVDIITYLPDSHTTLQENKGIYTRIQIQKDIEKLGKYKSDKTYIDSLNYFINRFAKGAPQIYKIGVGFWAHSRFNVERIQNLDMEILDYFIFIKADKSSWKIFSSSETKLFTINEGSVELPLAYEVGTDELTQLRLF